MGVGWGGVIYFGSTSHLDTLGKARRRKCVCVWVGWGGWGVGLEGEPNGLCQPCDCLLFRPVMHTQTEFLNCGDRGGEKKK